MQNSKAHKSASGRYSFLRCGWGVLGLFMISLSALAGAAPNCDQQLLAAIDSPLRSPHFAARDSYRHPCTTLAFFGLTPSSQVVEIWPGGGWYSEILAPYLAPAGKFYAAHFPAATEVQYFRKSRADFEQRVSAEAQLFNGTRITEFYPPSGAVAAPAGSADFVLTFRNVHNWMKAGFAPAAFEDFARLLKPGGVLGVVEHRAKPGTSEQQMIDSGYVTEARVIELATAAGLILEARSEINANPADSTDHPKGVWTLPPSLRLGDEDRVKYMAIGESDRMTLKFRKPVSGSGS
ncbi:class I SAM-dependent methyltransferase [Pseudomaricurvus alcaniphilus]|nr:class I SAM-dependent methyltransferase [Pseudomaricurvus alcaniphilus]